MKTALSYNPFSIILILAILSIGLTKIHAQFVPPDTTTYWMLNESGVKLPIQRAPDSLMIPGVVMIRFRDGNLDKAKLLNTYEIWYYGHKNKGKNTTLTYPYPPDPLPYDEVRGFPTHLQEELRTERFYFDSSNNIVLDDSLKHYLKNQQCRYLKRLTTASPFDTRSLTRNNDTIPCDHYNWMLLHFDSSINPLIFSYVLMALFPNDISFVQPDYHGGKLLHHPGDDRARYDSCQFSLKSMINVEKAWDYEVGDSDIIIAHYDLGGDYRHPDLGGGVGPGFHVRYGEQFAVNGNGTIDPVYGNGGHGTPCLGIIGALTNRNFHTVAGIAGGWGTLTQNATDGVERGQGCSLAILASAGQLKSATYVAAMFEASARSLASGYGYGVHVTNISGLISGYDYAVKAACNYAYENGVVQVAAMNESPNGKDGVDETNATPDRVTYPAGHDEPWIIAVGGEVLDTSPFSFQKIKPSYYGRTMDLLAPDGDNSVNSTLIFGTPPNADTVINCRVFGNDNFIYSTQSITDPPHSLANPLHTYRGFAGTSASAPHVAGSAGLLVSYFYRQNRTLEPEDIAGILKASAFRGDRDRSDHSTPDDWRPQSGWGYLDIGKAFEMLDSLPGSFTHSAYELKHYNVSDTSKMIFGAWTTNDSVLKSFDAPWDAANGLPVSMIKFANRSYLLNTSNNNHLFMARVRPVTATITLDSIWEVNQDAPLFAWGRAGSITEKSGWSYNNNPNFQNGWTRINDGLGGNLLNEGIFHSQNVNFTLETAQYEIWEYDSITKKRDKYIGHFPPDSLIGMNFSVFGRISNPNFTSVATKPIIQNSEMTVSVAQQTVTARFYSSLVIVNPKIEIFDMLGRIIAEHTEHQSMEGWNVINCQTKPLSSGTYVCRMSGSEFVQSSVFSIVK